jgi:hypothetical protein
VCVDCILNLINYIAGKNHYFSFWAYSIGYDLLRPRVGLSVVVCVFAVYFVYGNASLHNDMYPETCLSQMQAHFFEGSDDWHLLINW